jgi:5-hydroxyisourate hydrolase-like protein (transthyretin family)
MVMTGLVATTGFASAQDILDPPLEGRGHISGVVTDATDGTPVQGVAAELYNQTPAGNVGSFIGTLNTDETGRYAFTNRLPKCYIVRIIAPEGRTINDGPSIDLPQCIEAGDVILDLDAALDPPASGPITGGVFELDELSTPVADVKVDLFTANANGGRGDFIGFTFTGTDGRFIFEDQSDGCYVATFIAPEGRTFEGDRRFHQPGVCVELGIADADLTVGLDPIVVLPTGELGGLVSELEGAPVPGVDVELLVDIETSIGGGGTIDTAVTGDDGRYLFSAVADGCYQVRFIAPPGRTFAGGPSLNVDACVEEGGSNLEVDATIDADILSSLGGLVEEADGTGVADVAVTIFASDEIGTVGEQVAATSTGDDGTYAETLPAGCYVVRITAPTDRTIGEATEVDLPACVEAAEIRTDLGATLDPVPTGSIAGVVTDSDDTPLVDVKVDLFEANEDGSRGAFLGFARTGDDGSFGFADLEARCYTLTFIAPEGRTFTNGRRWFQPTRCVEAGVETVVDAQLAPDAALNGTLSGAITDLADVAVAGVKVDLFNSVEGRRDSFVGFTNTDDAGAYSFSVPAGCYIITMIAPDGAEFATGRFFQTSTICVESSGEVTGIDGRLLSGLELGSLGGVVVDGADLPVPDVKVTYWATTADGARGDFLGREDSDEQGLFSKSLADGCYWAIGVAPEGTTINGGQFAEIFDCLEEAEVIDAIVFEVEPLPVG